MNRTWMAAAFIMLSMGIALAADVHLKGGANSEPAFVDGGLTLNVAAALSGLGNEDVLITVDATADVFSTCTNKGGNQAPGQNPAEVLVSGFQALPADAIKNGNVDFNVTTIAPETPIEGAPGCPNANWSQTIDQLLFTSATITVEQPAGDVVLTVQCEFAAPTLDGPVDGTEVLCVQTQF